MTLGDKARLGLGLWHGRLLGLIKVACVVYFKDS